MFGEENKAKLRPIIARLIIINRIDVFLFRKIKQNSPKVVIPIPEEARICELILSDKRPVIGESTAIIMGWDKRMRPDRVVPIFCTY